MPDLPADAALHVAPFADLDARTWHDLVRLRIDVFVVEQECAYGELDGRDVEPATRHLWVSRGGRVAAYLRLLEDRGGGAHNADVRRVGRVCVRRSDRGRGLAEVLMRRAIDECGPVPIVLDAQSHLQGWYERLGFVRDGEEFLDDGIPHVPMRREGRGTY